MKPLSLLAPFLIGACAAPAAQPIPSTVGYAPSIATPPAVVSMPQPQPPAEPRPAPQVTQVPPPPPATPSELAIAKSNRAFAVSLYRKLATQPGNVFVSPISIAGAFGPVAAGARRNTRAEIGKVLQFPADDEVLHESLGSILRTLEAGGSGPQVSIANGLWVSKRASIEPSFVDLSKRSYDAAVDALDFRNSEAAAARINAWVDRETNSRIPQLFEPDAFDQNTALVITNAVHFLGKWSQPFDPSRTRRQPFHLADGTTREVPMMYASDMVARCTCSESTPPGAARTGAVHLLELPYEGGRLSMVVILPRARNGLRAIEPQLNAAMLDKWLQRVDAAPLHVAADKLSVSLPKVQIESSYNLAKPLQALGMKIPFIPSRADFSGISAALGNRLFIDDVVHKTFLRVDEKGTEAAGATGIEVSLERGGPEFRADHPFLFLIRDKSTGAVLFLGRIAEP